jgi:hypothetical protein
MDTIGWLFMFVIYMAMLAGVKYVGSWLSEKTGWSKWITYPLVILISGVIITLLSGEGM